MDATEEVSRSSYDAIMNGEMINDEAINTYLAFVASRRSRQIHAFSTFFYAQLQREGHAGVSKWIQRTAIFDKALWLIPIHMPMHWTLVVVLPHEHKMEYYDSLGGSPETAQEVMSGIRNFILEERGARGMGIEGREWDMRHIMEGPRQSNGIDCGIFLCKTAEIRSRMSYRPPMRYSTTDTSVQLIRQEICRVIDIRRGISMDRF